MDSQDQTFKTRDKFIHDAFDPTPFESKFREGALDTEELIAHLGDFEVGEFRVPPDFPHGEEAAEAEPFIGPHLPPLTRPRNPVHQGTFFNKIKVVVFLARLLFIVKHDYSDLRFLTLIQRILYDIVQRCNKIITTVFSFKYKLSPVAQQDQHQRLFVFAYQVVRTLPRPVFQDNLEARISSGIPFQVQPDEDNPFLLFCRQYFNPVSDVDFDQFVRLAYVYYSESYDAIAEELGYEQFLIEYDRALATRTIEREQDGVYYPDFPPGFDIDRYCGAALAIFFSLNCPALQARLPTSVNVGERHE